MVGTGVETQTFGLEVSEEMVSSWQSKRRKRQLIGQGELLPILIARAVWKRELHNRKVVVYIDNDSARYACIRGWSEAEGSNEILDAMAVLDA
eukprot:579238-Amphidinium_carterae.1